MTEEIAIGIDLGTTYCCVAAYSQGEVIIIPNENFEGSKTTPSYVSFNKDNSVTVGQSAKDKAFQNLETTIFDAKRIIGRDFSDPVLQFDMKFWPFKVIDEDGVPKFKIRGRSYHPEEVSAKLLIEMREIAETHLQLEEGSIKKAVITVPAYFNDGQRQATVDAGRLAGLEVLSILNEPTSASIAYFCNRRDKMAKKVLIFDLGGGTLDVAVVEIKEETIEVLGIRGETHVGGQDFDKNMMLYCARKFQEETGIDLLKGKDSSVKTERDEVMRNLNRLQLACERSKRGLSGRARSTDVIIQAIVNGKDLCVEITKQTFEQINAELFKKCVKVLDEALLGAKVGKGEINDIVLIGGSTRMNKVQYLLEGYFEKKKLNKSINPDEAVAFGAAVQAAILTGTISEEMKVKRIQDVTGLSLGVKSSNGNFYVIIPRNTRIPVVNRGRRTAARNNQTSANITVYQGEFQVATQNKFLGEFKLEGLPPVDEGEPLCDVIMEINENGILQVSAVSIDSKDKSELTVVADKHRMSQQSIEELLKEMNIGCQEDERSKLADNKHAADGGSLFDFARKFF